MISGGRMAARLGEIVDTVNYPAAKNLAEKRRFACENHGFCMADRRKTP